MTVSLGQEASAQAEQSGHEKIMWRTRGLPRSSRHCVPWIADITCSQLASIFPCSQR